MCLVYSCKLGYFMGSKCTFFLCPKLLNCDRFIEFLFTRFLPVRLGINQHVKKKVV